MSNGLTKDCQTTFLRTWINLNKLNSCGKSTGSANTGISLKACRCLTAWTLSHMTNVMTWLENDSKWCFKMCAANQISSFPRQQPVACMSRRESLWQCGFSRKTHKYKYFTVVYSNMKTCRSHRRLKFVNFVQNIWGCANNRKLTAVD